MATLINKEGKITGKIKKDTVTSRRDNCKYLKRVYDAVEDAVFSNKTYQEVQDIINDFVMKLLKRQHDEKDLVIYKAIATFEKYAKKEQGKDKRILAKKTDEDGNAIGWSRFSHFE